MSNISEAVKAAIESQIVLALKDTPDAINILVKSAIEGKVDSNGRPSSSGYGTPYLDYIVGEVIREEARKAVIEAVKLKAQEIATSVASQISVETLVKTMSEKILGVVNSEEWKIDITFKDKTRY